MWRVKRQDSRMNPGNTIIAIFAAVSVSLALAQNFQTINGKQYKNASVIHVEPDGITIKFDPKTPTYEEIHTLCTRYPRCDGVYRLSAGGNDGYGRTR